MAPSRTLTAVAAALALALATVPSPAQSVDSTPHHHVTSGESIQDAVDAAAPGDTVHIHAGVYEQAVWVNTTDLTIEGDGRGVTVLNGSDVHGYDRPHEHSTVPDPTHGHGGVDGFHVVADGVTVKNMSIRSFGSDGVEWNDVTGFYGRNLYLRSNALYGLNAYESEIGGFYNSYGTEHADSAFYVGEITSCQCVVQNVTAEGNLIGYSGTASSGVTIRDSTFRDNAAAIVPNVLVGTHHNEPQVHLFVHDNVIVDNNNKSASHKWHFDGTHVPWGLGVVIAGGSANLVTDNYIAGHGRAGVSVSWLFTEPSLNRIVDNTMDNPATDPYPKAVDILWDGGGANNCFEGNTRPDGSQATFDGGTLWNALGRPDCSTNYATPPSPSQLGRQVFLQLMSCEPGQFGLASEECHVEGAPGLPGGY